VRRVSSLQKVKLCNQNRRRRRRRRWFDDKEEEEGEEEKKEISPPSITFLWALFRVPRQSFFFIFFENKKTRSLAHERYTRMARRLIQNDAQIAYPCKWRNRLSVLKRERKGRKWSARVSEIYCFYHSVRSRREKNFDGGEAKKKRKSFHAQRPRHRTSATRQIQRHRWRERVSLQFLVSFWWWYFRSRPLFF